MHIELPLTERDNSLLLMGTVHDLQLSQRERLDDLSQTERADGIVQTDRIAGLELTERLHDISLKERTEGKKGS